jgi:hypothetical protein
VNVAQIPALTPPVAAVYLLLFLLARMEERLQRTPRLCQNSFIAADQQFSLATLLCGIR